MALAQGRSGTSQGTILPGMMNASPIDSAGTRCLPSSLVREKHARILAGEAPRTLDLFSGCGGLSLGFDAAGFKTVAAVEMDGHASRSHALNFFGRELAGAQLEAHAQAKDITQTDPAELLARLGYPGPAERIVDVIIGGPPCQAFARVGRAKLREIARHPEAFLKDPRGNLYLRYLHYVDQLKPLALLMENVPDVLNYGGHNIAEETCEILSEMGYTCGYTLLNAAHYGVPQMRERMFLVAIASEVTSFVRFPQPSHWMNLPKGYHNSRQVAMQTVRRGVDGSRFFIPPPAHEISQCVTAVSAEMAIGDLPLITDHLLGRARRGAPKLHTSLPYRENVQPSAFAKLMRTWPGFETCGVTNHVTRSLPRDYAIFQRMKAGDEYPAARKLAVQLFEQRLSRLRASSGMVLGPRTAAYKVLWAATVPPYDPGKFPNKWRKMEASAPARTLMAHLGKDGYSHIHYDSTQARTISVREAARLQSFPDRFVLSGAMNAAFRQIGNAVPALLGKALAGSIYSQLTHAHGPPRMRRARTGSRQTL
jgi:DNA (cytosine-5)-methyltransferase 1